MSVPSTLGTDLSTIKHLVGRPNAGLREVRRTVDIVAANLPGEVLVRSRQVVWVSGRNSGTAALARLEKIAS